ARFKVWLLLLHRSAIDEGRLSGTAGHLELSTCSCRRRCATERAYTFDRRAGRGSSDSSIPSVKFTGSYARAFSAAALSETTEVTLIVPTSIVLRLSGQTIEESFVESPALGSCTTRRNATGPAARRDLI